MNDAKRPKVVNVVRTYPEARRRAYAETKPVQPTPGQVNMQRFQLLEDALTQGLERIEQALEALDTIERVTTAKVERVGVLLERYRAMARRARKRAR